VTSPETFGYTLVHYHTGVTWFKKPGKQFQSLRGTRGSPGEYGNTWCGFDVVLYVAGLNAASSSHRPSMTLIVPATSYSSSEEEDFYDANEYNDTPSSSASPTMYVTAPFVCMVS
jgi:hypothetical protein